jgi:hypothetical protein
MFLAILHSLRLTGAWVTWTQPTRSGHLSRGHTGRLTLPDPANHPWVCVPDQRPAFCASLSNLVRDQASAAPSTTITTTG